MTTFKSIACNSSRTLGVHPLSSLGRGIIGVFIHVPGATVLGIDLDPKDAPAIALAVLEAAGVRQSETHLPEDNLEAAANYLAEGVRMMAQKAKEAAMDKRRDELAEELAPRSAGLGSGWYGNVSDGLRRAIDRIIDLEQERETK